MKNINRIMLSACVLISTSAIANLIQPLSAISEEAPLRFSIAAKSGIGPNRDGQFRASGVGGGIGFTHNAGYGFNWGLAAAYDYTSPTGHVFTETSKKEAGSRIDAELFFGYMPELADNFHLGLNAGIGWGRQFGGETAKKINENMKFGDLRVKVGPAFSYGLSDSVSMYFAVLYSLHNIRFGAEDTAKIYANSSGVDLPLGFTFGVGDSAAVFVEANSRFFNIAKGAKYFKEEVTLGMSFAI